MYHPFIESAALTLVDIPITFITIVVYTLSVYFFVGLQASAGQYLSVAQVKSSSHVLTNPFSVFLLFIFCMALTMKAWFRTLAAAFKAPSPAQTVSGIVLLAMVLYTGYIIPQVGQACLYLSISF